MTDDPKQNRIAELVEKHRPGSALSQNFYNDPEIYDLEIEAIFLKHWLFAAHVSQIPDVGDYVLCEFAKESVIVVQAENNEIKAHINVCRHRGSRICLEKHGSRGRLTCPYHAWTYDLHGALVAAPQMLADFPKAEHGLRSVHVEVIDGFIFICLAKKPLSMARLNSELADIRAQFGFNHLKLATTKSYPMSANWKLAVENYQECYHCASAHKEFARIHAMARPLDAFDKQKAAYKKSYPRNEIMSEINAYFDLTEKGDEGFQYDRNPLLDGKVTGSKDGRQLAPLLGKLNEYTGGASELMIGPLMYFLIYDDHVVGYRFLPVSQTECVCDVYWFVRDDAVPEKDYDVEELTWLWDVTTKSDQTIIENNQRGVDSRFYVPGHLSDKEHFLQSFQRWYLETLA